MRRFFGLVLTLVVLWPGSVLAGGRHDHPAVGVYPGVYSWTGWGVQPSAPQPPSVFGVVPDPWRTWGVRETPPPVIIVPTPPATWVPGSWWWNGFQWVWTPGHWVWP